MAPRAYAPLAIVLALACAPPSGMPSGAEASTGEELATTSSSTGSGSVGSGETTVEAGSSSGSTGVGESTTGLEQEQSQACITYLDCTEVANPIQFPYWEDKYGPDADCWHSGYDNAQQCNSECMQAYADLVQGLEDDDAAIPPECGGEISLAFDVQPIFDEFCVDKCHEPGGVWAIFDLRPLFAFDNIVGVPGPTQAVHMNLIEPGDPNASYLWHKISGTQGSVGGTGQQAPDDAPPLTQDRLDTIEAWILAGAPP